MNKIKGLLGLANAARKITYGETALKDIQSQKAKLVIISLDASDNTKKKYSDKAKYYNIPFVMLDEFLINESIGRNNIKTLAINDQGFASKIIEMIER